MDIIGMDYMGDPEAIFHHVDWKPGLVDVAEVAKNYDLPQVKFCSFSQPHLTTGVSKTHAIFV